MNGSVLNYVMLAVIVVIIIFMFRNSRKRKRDTEELQQKFVPGAEVMTNFGLFGTIVSIDSDSNKVVLETSPGQTITVHRQVVSRVVDAAPSEAETAEAAQAEAKKAADNAPIILNGEPQYGERITPTDTTKTDSSKTDE